jgi:hypothetical protein
MGFFNFYDITIALMDIKYVFSQTMFASYAEAFVLTDAF